MARAQGCQQCRNVTVPLTRWTHAPIGKNRVFDMNVSNKVSKERPSVAHRVNAALDEIGGIEGSAQSG